MTFIESYAEENRLPAFFVVVMLRMAFTSVGNFCKLTPRRRDRVLAEFAVEVMEIAADSRDDYHDQIKQHLIKTYGSFKFANYIAPMAVETMLDGKKF